MSGEEGTYEFLISTKLTFSLRSSVARGEATLLTGRKHVHVAEKSFLEKYGMTMGLMAFMMISQYLKYKMRPQELQATPTAAAAAAPAESKKTQ